MNDWQPQANNETLKKRAQIIDSIRRFFAEREILEVQTPNMASHTVTDPHLSSFTVGDPSGKTFNAYLQTSPEFHMKRLLAANSGPIYQMCKSFRFEEQGRLHNAEFTMLEWYRPGFNHHDLMQEVDALCQTILNTKPADILTYREIFLKYCDIDPFDSTNETLKQTMNKFEIEIQGIDWDDKDTLLTILLTHCIEPNLGRENPCFIHDYPPTQAALAKIHNGVAERFELYYKGTELANGFHELSDADEQQHRMQNNLIVRKKYNLPQPEIDPNFIAALKHGLPTCAGVALGIDRLIMFALDKKTIHDVVSFL